MRRFGYRVPESAEAIAAPMVGENQQDVRRVGVVRLAHELRPRRRLSRPSARASRHC